MKKKIIYNFFKSLRRKIIKFFDNLLINQPSKEKITKKLLLIKDRVNEIPNNLRMVRTWLINEYYTFKKYIIFKIKVEPFLYQEKLKMWFIYKSINLYFLCMFIYKVIKIFIFYDFVKMIATGFPSSKFLKTIYYSKGVLMTYRGRSRRKYTILDIVLYPLLISTNWVRFAYYVVNILEKLINFYYTCLAVVIYSFMIMNLIALILYTFLFIPVIYFCKSIYYFSRSSIFAYYNPFTSLGRAFIGFRVYFDLHQALGDYGLVFTKASSFLIEIEVIQTFKFINSRNIPIYTYLLGGYPVSRDLLQLFLHKPKDLIYCLDFKDKVLSVYTQFFLISFLWHDLFPVKIYPFNLKRSLTIPYGWYLALSITRARRLRTWYYDRFFNFINDQPDNLRGAFFYTGFFKRCLRVFIEILAKSFSKIFLLYDLMYAIRKYYIIYEIISLYDIFYRYFIQPVTKFYNKYLTSLLQFTNNLSFILIIYYILIYIILIYIYLYIGEMGVYCLSELDFLMKSMYFLQNDIVYTENVGKEATVFIENFYVESGEMYEIYLTQFESEKDIYLESFSSFEIYNNFIHNVFYKKKICDIFNNVQTYFNLDNLDKTWFWFINLFEYSVFFENYENSFRHVFLFFENLSDKCNKFVKRDLVFLPNYLNEIFFFHLKYSDFMYLKPSNFVILEYYKEIISYIIFSYGLFYLLKYLLQDYLNNNMIIRGIIIFILLFFFF